MLAALCFLGFCVTAIMFVVYWWKKRKARLAAGENYQDDEHYQHVSARKRLIGWICFLSFMGIIISPKISESLMTPEEKIAYQEEKAQREAEAKRRADEKKAKEEAEAKRLAEEKAAQEAEAKRLAEEKAAQEAEAKRRADEKKAKEAEAKRLAEEKKAQEEAEAKRLAEEKAAQEAEAKRLAEEKAAQEAEAKRLADEKAQQEAEAKRLADEKAAQEAEDSGLWDSAKSFVKDKLSDAKDFAGGVVSNEVYVCDKKFSWDKKPSSYYIIPSTKKRHDDGVVFKDEGYEIEVICKDEDGAVLKSDIYLFCERSDGTWEYKREQDNSWQRIKHTYSEQEKEWNGDLGKLIYDASKNFPNL